jgi:hypothetical protein
VKKEVVAAAAAAFLRPFFPSFSRFSSLFFLLWKSQLLTLSSSLLLLRLLLPLPAAV